MIINVKVHPKSSKQEVVKTEKGYDVYLKSAPENNKANVELIKILKKYFNKEIEIKSGFTSKHKIIEVK